MDIVDEVGALLWGGNAVDEFGNRAGDCRQPNVGKEMRWIEKIRKTFC